MKGNRLYWLCQAAGWLAITGFYCAVATIYVP